MMHESTMQPSVPETIGARFDVVALVTSAGGLEAPSTVLRALPSDLPAAVLVAQHLSGQGSSLAGILRRRITLHVT
jgi:chemotaxis response regulator CheB